MLVLKNRIARFSNLENKEVNTKTKIEPKYLNLIGFIISVVSLIVIAVIYNTVGVTVKSNELYNYNTSFIGWGNSGVGGGLGKLKYGDLTNDQAGIFYFTDKLEFKPFKMTGLTNKLELFSILCWVSNLILTIVLFAYTLASFKGKVLISNKKLRHFTLLIWVLLIITFASLFRIATKDLITTHNKTITEIVPPKVLIIKFYLADKSLATEYVPIFCSIFTGVSCSYLNRK